MRVNSTQGLDKFGVNESINIIAKIDKFFHFMDHILSNEIV